MKYSPLYLASIFMVLCSAYASDPLFMDESTVRVLFVDDLEVSQKVVKRKLSDATNTIPFTVDTCASRREALRAIKEEGKQYHIIISDLETGEEDITPEKFARSARKNSKDLEGIFLYTACKDDTVLSDPELSIFDKIIPKNPQTLLKEATVAHGEYRRKKSLEASSPRLHALSENEGLTVPLLAPQVPEPNSLCGASLDNVVGGLVGIIFKLRDRMC